MKLVSTMIVLFAGALASSPAPAGVVVSTGFHGGHGGYHGYHGGHIGYYGGYHGGYHGYHGGGVRFGFGVYLGPPFWGPSPWYYPPSYYYPPAYYSPPPVVYTNPPVIVTPSQPSYSPPPLAAPGTPGNPIVELPPTNNAPQTGAAPPPSTPPAVAQAAPQQLFMYPRQNQDAQLQARDRDECYRWALGQLGYDPSKSTAGLSPSQSADYYRAMTACLDGRGYSVR